MDRRDFLKRALGTSVLASTTTPGVAAAAAARRGVLSDEEAAIDAQVSAIRAALAAREAHVLGALQERVAQATAAPIDAELGETLAVLARGVGASTTLGDLDALPVRTQAHPWLQALLLEVGERVGAALLVVQDLLVPVADGLPLAQPTLLGALAEVEQITLAVLPDAQQGLGRRSLQRLREQVVAGDMQGFARHTLRRIRALQQIAVRASATGGRSRFLTRDAPALAAEVQAARDHWAGAAAQGGGMRVALVVVGILGLIACGFLIYYGVVIAALGVVSLVVCPCAGVVILAAGAMIITAGVVVGVISVALLLGVSLDTLTRRVQGRRRASETGAISGTTVEVGDVVVQADAGWVAAGVTLRRSMRYRVDARGQTHDPIDDDVPLGPGGDPQRLGGPGTRLPGAPMGALLGRVDGTVFLIGAARTLPEGHTGVLRLAINVETARAAQRVGGLTVFVAPLG